MIYMGAKSGRGKSVKMIPVPKMGNNASGCLIEHAKKPGSKVKKGDVICYVEYGKFTDEFKSPVDGIVQAWYVPEEGTVRVGADLLSVEVEGEDAGPGGGFGAGYGEATHDHLATAAAELQRQAEKRSQALATSTLLAASMGSAMNMGSAMANLPGLPGLPNLQGLTGGLAGLSGSTRPSLAMPGLPSSIAASLASLGAAATAQVAQAQAATKTAAAGYADKSTTSSAGGWEASSATAAANNSRAGWTASVSTLASAVSAASTPSAASRKASDRESSTPAKPAEPTMKPEDLEKLKCHLHKKANKKCKFCERYLSAKTKNDEELNARKKAFQQQVATEMSFNCSPLLKEQVVNCSYYKSLMLIENVDDLISEIKQFASDSVDVYRNSMDPSPFMCCVYRLFTFNLPEEELRWVVDNPESVYVRCVAFLYFRFVVPPNQLWEKVEEYILDDADIEVTEMNGQVVIKTVGEYIEDLLLKEKYYGTPLPRLPASVRIKLEENIAPMGQFRKRAAANKRVFSNLRASDVNMTVEVHDDGRWIAGRAVRVENNEPTRMKLLVKMQDGRELITTVGKVLLPDVPAHPERERSRSPNRGRGGGDKARGNSPDWSRTRGKSDKELIQELRDRSRDEAVCTNRKDYAKRLPRFESGLAIRREKGTAEAKLIEEETFITPGMRLRHEHNHYDEEEEENLYFAMKRRSQEEEEERKARMKDIYEKYGSGASGKINSSASRSHDFDGPDTMRLG